MGYIDGPRCLSLCFFRSCYTLYWYTERLSNDDTNMAWKDLADQLSNELKIRNDEIAHLRRQLAGCEEQLANNTPNSQANTGHVHQVISLQRELDSTRAEKDKFATESALLNERLQNNLAKLASLDEKTGDEIQTLRNQLAGKNEQLRRAQATRASDQTTSRREKDLQDQVAKLKGEINSAKAENATLKRTADSLSRQLQVEKAENAKRIGFMRSDPTKGYDEDDEEPLPDENAARKEKSKAAFAMASAEPAPTFKTMKIPDFLKPNSPATIASKPSDSLKQKKAPAPKKRKRSAQEEIDDELTELGGPPTFDLPTRSRRKDPVTYNYSAFWDEAMTTYDESEAMPEAAKANKKKRVAPPATPASQSAVEPFNFKAVCTYKVNGNIDSFYSSKDLKGRVGELWERLEIVTATIWEHKAGDDWQWEVLKPASKSKTPICITKKCQKQRARWNAGFEGVYACKDCAETGRPCFTYVPLEKGDDGYDYGEFRLLPLHEKDRKKAVGKDKEIRYWINDGVKLVDPDSMDEDEEYT